MHRPGSGRRGGISMTRTVVRTAGVLLAVVSLATGCKSSDKATPDNSKTTSSKPAGDVGKAAALKSRFAKTDTFCVPSTAKPAETPKAIDDGITADSISI